jgi:hypothetical protein
MTDIFSVIGLDKIRVTFLQDEATKGIQKNVCDGQEIFRAQQIMVIEKQLIQK